MTQEEKQLLIKDLCARLPYEVQGITSEGVVSPLLTKGEADWDILTSLNYRIVKHGWRPYLRPMSSMTEEEKKELWEELDKDMEILDENIDAQIINVYKGRCYRGNPVYHEIDFLNKKHFDWRGLISKGLALEAPDGMYGSKQTKSEQEQIQELAELKRKLSK